MSYQPIYNFTTSKTLNPESVKKSLEILRGLKQQSDQPNPELEKLEDAYVDHLIWRFGYPKLAFRQQLWASGLITLLVVGLVVCGLIFSFVQLKFAVAVNNFSSLNTNLGLTASKVSINSSIIGAITLIISLAFFVFYLKYVFRIEHPLPPHVSLSDTDAYKLRSRKIKKLTNPFLFPKFTSIHKG